MKVNQAIFDELWNGEKTFASLFVQARAFGS
jgi:hypothetical protein